MGIRTSGGALGFVDDFTAWVAGPLASDNTRRLQEEVTPKVEAWADESSVTFEADKTDLFHFTRVERRHDAPSRPLTFQGKSILGSEQVKVLGVVLDDRLTMEAHVARVTSKAITQCLAIKKLRVSTLEA